MTYTQTEKDFSSCALAELSGVGCNTPQLVKQQELLSAGTRLLGLPGAEGSGASVLTRVLQAQRRLPGFCLFKESKFHLIL